MAGIKYKGTDGQWHLLNNPMVRGNVVQTSGTSTTDVMSQSAVTEIISTIQGGGGSVDQVIDSSTSASTNAVSTKAVYGFVTAYTPSITVDQVIDSNTSASTNAVSTKAVFDYTTASYSSATEVNSALSHKANANHNQSSATITAMTNYSSGGTVSPIQTSDTLNQAIGKLETRFDGIRLLKITQTDYDNLQTKDPNTLYVITD